MCKMEEQAYMTVEASLVLPTVIGGIIFILYLGIFLYNYCTINQTAYIAALRGSQIKNVSTDEIDNYVKKQIDELLFQNILAREEVKKEVSTSIGKVTVKMSTDVNIPFSDLLSAKIHIWEIKTEGYANRVNPIEIIRGVRKINGH
ncbi:MAG: pilus assembly protein [Lachnospiraceae bacterium]|nr:pilus assembly protein [Lachnospiraceae bacterium]